MVRFYQSVCRIKSSCFVPVCDSRNLACRYESIAFVLNAGRLNATSILSTVLPFHGEQGGIGAFWALVGCVQVQRSEWEFVGVNAVLVGVWRSFLPTVRLS